MTRAPREAAPMYSSNNSNSCVMSRPVTLTVVLSSVGPGGS